MSLPEKYKVVLAHNKGQGPTIEDRPLPTPAENQILVKIAFAPLNPTDILILDGTGIYPLPGPPPYLIGLEGSGTVVAVGKNLTVLHQVGDRVHVGGPGTFGQYILADSDKCRKIQDGLSFEEACAHFINPATVVAMGDYALKNGHKTVIHTAGSSALGRMLIRYLKYKGIKTINIVRRDDFTEELKKEGADYVLNSQTPDFETQLKEIAHKEEATLCFEAVCGELTGKVLRNQPNGSVCAIYGVLGGTDISALNVQQFIFEGKTITGFHMGKHFESAAKTGEAQKLLDEIYDLLPTVLRTNIQKVFKLEDINEALEFYKQNSSKGKILFQPN